MIEALTPVKVFCSYAHEDEVWWKKLETHLSLLKRQGLVSFWHDRLITPGTDWVRAIDARLETASVILLLLSADFFASDYCYGIEMKRALEREAAGEARVIPILVRPVDWKGAPFAHLQALPTGVKPIASWQNKDAALADVAAGIRRVIVEELPQFTASAPRAALPAVWNIPYPRNPFFLGRESELLRIHQNLQAGHATALSQPQAISGLGGIGKTQLALEYAYQYHQDYQIVLWARAESREALVSSYVTIALLLRLPEREAQEQNLTVQAVKIWLQTHREWLLILDNADDLTLLPDFLPPTLGGHLLLTTRATATGRLAHRLEIETLLPEQGALFLLRRAGLITPDATLEQAFLEERNLALHITQELGGLPLALDQAGAYLEETGTDLTAYWRIYQKHHTALLKERRGVVADHPASVATTWSLSFQKVEEKNPAAADLLRLCAFLYPDSIAEEILTEGALVLGPVLSEVVMDAFLLDQAIEVLRAYSLMQRDPRRKVLSIHRLVQAVLKDELEETVRYYWAERAVWVINAAFPELEHAIRSQCERLLPHALLAAQLIEVYQVRCSEAGHLLFLTASYLLNCARYQEAELLYLHALHVWGQALGSEHPDLAYILNNQAILYREQGKYEQAEPLYKRALHIWEQALGSEHPNVAYALNSLGTLYREQGKYEQADLLYQRALHIREHALGSEDPDVAAPLNNQATLYYEQGKYEQAEPLYQRALHIWEQALGSEHPNLAIPLNGLANLYREQGEYEQAELLYQRALHIWEQALGSEHTYVAYPLNNLAILYRKQGKYEQAELLNQRALDIWEHALSPEHPQVAYSLNCLANIYRDQRRYKQAEPLYRRALSIREQRLELHHPETAEAMHDFAVLQEAQGNRDEAKILYEYGLTVREQVLGAHHPKTEETRTCLIALLHTLGQHEEAAQLEATQFEL